MASTSFYEIVVVGTDLSGLVLAALAAKRGYRVLVLGQGYRPDVYDCEGFPFHRRPRLFYGLSASPAAEFALVELGLNIEIRNLLRPISPRYQFVMPAHRIDFDADPAVLERELEREFPGRLPVVERFLRGAAEDNALVQAVLEENPPLPPEGMRERRRYRQAVSRLVDLQSNSHGPFHSLPRAEPVSALLLAPLPFLAQPDLDSIGHVPGVRAAVHAAQGFHTLAGGFDRLIGLLLDKLTSHCGVYRPDDSVEQLRVVRGKVRSIRLRHRNEELGCKLVICNGDPKRFFQLVPHERQRERYHNTVRSLLPTHYQASLNVALRGEIVQQGMCPVVFLVSDPARPLEDDNLLMLTSEQGAAAEEGDAPYRVLTASCLVRARHFAPRLAFARELERRLLAKLAMLVPFLEERTLAAHLTWLPRDPDGSELAMSEVVPHYAPAMPRSLEASALSCVSGYKNVLVGGDALFSGFGLEGAFLTALTLLRHVTRRVVLKSLLDD